MKKKKKKIWNNFSVFNLVMQAQYSMQSQPMGLWLWSSSCRSTWFCWPVETDTATSKRSHLIQLVLPIFVVVDWIEIDDDLFLLSSSSSFVLQWETKRKCVIHSSCFICRFKCCSNVKCILSGLMVGFLLLLQPYRLFKKNEPDFLKRRTLPYVQVKKQKKSISMSIVCYKRWSTADIRRRIG